MIFLSNKQQIPDSKIQPRIFSFFEWKQTRKKILMTERKIKQLHVKMFSKCHHKTSNEFVTELLRKYTKLSCKILFYQFCILEIITFNMELMPLSLYYKFIGTMLQCLRKKMTHLNMSAD